MGPRPLRTSLRNNSGSADTVICLLKVYECCIEGVAKMFGLVDEGIGNKDMVGSLVKAPWKGWEMLASAMKCIYKASG